MDLTIFKDYDVRGVYPTQINGDVAKKIAYAIVKKFAPKKIAICRDMRLSGEEIKNAFVKVFLQQGIDVYDAGLTGTENAYFIAGSYDYDLVIMISASHNPKEFNGFKLVKKGPVAITSESGLYDIRDLVNDEDLPDAQKKGNYFAIDTFPQWKEKILSLININEIKPLTVVIDAGNAMAGKLVPLLFDDLPVKMTKMYFEIDGNFPNHVPNPLIFENTKDLADKVIEIKADLGITFDGDADRMFLVDDLGRIISGTITTALLAKYILSKFPGELILYNAICGRIVPEIIEKSGGKSKRVRVGHSYIKTYMRDTNAVFAGEHSGHYYFRDFYFAESGILSALMVISLLSVSNIKLSTLIDELNIYPSSGEINFTVNDIPKVIEVFRNEFTDSVSKDEIDGISIWYKDYWFNVRASKTEPVLRLNIEADNAEILEIQKQKLISKIESLGGIKK